MEYKYRVVALFNKDPKMFFQILLSFSHGHTYCGLGSRPSKNVRMEAITFVSCAAFLSSVLNSFGARNTNLGATWIGISDSNLDWYFWFLTDSELIFSDYDTNLIFGTDIFWFDTNLIFRTDIFWFWHKSHSGKFRIKTDIYVAKNFDIFQISNIFRKIRNSEKISFQIFFWRI